MFSTQTFLFCQGEVEKGGKLLNKMQVCLFGSQLVTQLLITPEKPEALHWRFLNTGPGRKSNDKNPRFTKLNVDDWESVTIRL